MVRSASSSTPDLGSNSCFYFNKALIYFHHFLNSFHCLPHWKPLRLYPFLNDKITFSHALHLYFRRIPTAAAACWSSLREPYRQNVTRSFAKLWENLLGKARIWLFYFNSLRKSNELNQLIEDVRTSIHSGWCGGEFGNYFKRLHFNVGNTLCYELTWCISVCLLARFEIMEISLESILDIQMEIYLIYNGDILDIQWWYTWYTMVIYLIYNGDILDIQMKVHILLKRS